MFRDKICILWELHSKILVGDKNFFILMDKRKGYVLLLMNAGVRNSVSERKKISAAAPLRVMASRYNPCE
jgi:hypothetical protein